MWKIPRIWDGGQCFIIGGGTSIPLQFDIPSDVVKSVYQKQVGPEVYSPYMSALHSQHIIAVNMSYKLGSWVDCMFFGDTDFLHNRQVEVLTWPGLRVTTANGMDNYRSRLKIVDRDTKKKLGVSFLPDTICWNINSGASAINLAYHFGVSRIFLLGFDMRLDNDKNQHWHKYYSSNPKTIESTMKMHLRCFPYIADDLRGKVEIINVSPDSEITSFPKMSFNEVIQKGLL